MALQPDTPVSYSHTLVHSMERVVGFIFLMFNKQRDESPSDKHMFPFYLSLPDNCNVFTKIPIKVMSIPVSCVRFMGFYFVL